MFKKVLGLVTVLVMLGTVPASAATVLLDTQTHTYGNPGFDPGGNDVLTAAGVTVSDQSSSRFFDSFDFSTLAYTSIDYFKLTLDFMSAGPSLFPGEVWSVRVQGSNTGSSGDDLFVPLLDVLAPQTLYVSALTDLLGNDAFLSATTSEMFTFWFSENSGRADAFNLASAKLDIYGVAAVPVPAAGLLLVGALGGLAALRRRKQRAV